MTLNTTALTHKPISLDKFPEFPPRDDMQNSSHLHLRSIITTLTIHYARLKRKVFVHSEVPVAPSLSPWGSYRIPDLIVSFDDDIENIYDIQGYAIDQQGKPPDFVLEVASHTTGVTDYTAKRADYERYGIPEYWRFDDTGGRYHDVALAGDILVEGRYRPIEIEWLDDTRCRGYSEALGLYVCWEDGMLRFYDPASQSYLRTHYEDADLANEAAERADAEAEARRTAEARVAELEAELHRLRGE